VIITFTGPQSSGKTTLLKRMKSNDFIDKFYYVEEVTRLIKRDFNIPINEEGANDTTQTLIINKEFENLFIYPKPWPDCEGIVHDRCLLDGMIYTEYFADSEIREPSHSDGRGPKAKDGYNISLELSKRYWKKYYQKYDVIFYPDPHDVKLEDDGERSTSTEFRNAIIERYEEYWTHNEWAHKNQLVILRGTVEERMEQIKIVLNKRGIFSKK